MQFSMNLRRAILFGFVMLTVPFLYAATLADFSVTNIDGKNQTLSDYHGSVVLVVNTASHCGFTPQYEGLEQLYQEYKALGLVILGFPSNDFLGQEPGSNEEIKAFCTETYNVTFPMFSKITVVGSRQHPLYRWLTSKSSDPRFAGPITWNFNKFLIGRDGTILARFDSSVKPESKLIKQAIEAALAQSLEPAKP